MVVLVTTIQRFQGESGDVKPPDAPDGSTFHSVDTGQEWVMHDGMWELDLRAIRSS